MGIKVYNGFFHYHHEEVQYWSAVLLRVSQGEATAPTNRTLGRQGAKRYVWQKGLGCTGCVHLGKGMFVRMD